MAYFKHKQVTGKKRLKKTLFKKNGKHIHVHCQQVCRGTDGQARLNIFASRHKMNSQLKNLNVWKVKQSARG